MTPPAGPDRKSWQRDFEQLMRDDPAGVEKAAEEIKSRYAQLFKI